jgi:hypothetical protein
MPELTLNSHPTRALQVPLGGGAVAVVTVIGDGLFRLERRPAWISPNGDQRATFNVINRVAAQRVAVNHTLNPRPTGGSRLVVASETAEIVVEAPGGGEHDGAVTFTCSAGAGAARAGRGSSAVKTSSWVSE